MDIIFLIIFFLLALAIVIIVGRYIIKVVRPVDKEMKGFKSIDYNKERKGFTSIDYNKEDYRIW